MAAIASAAHDVLATGSESFVQRSTPGRFLLCFLREAVGSGAVSDDSGALAGHEEDPCTCE